MKGLQVFSLLLIGVCFNEVLSQNYTYTINPGNGLNRGEWGPAAFCPEGSYAGEFELKYEPWGSTDVTNANAVKLYCVDEDGVFLGYVTSTEGSQGSWQGIRSCPQGVFINAFSMDVTPERGPFEDNVGVVDVKMICEDSTVLDGLTPSTIKRSESEDGEDTNMPIMPYTNLIYKLTDEDRKKLSKNKKLHLNPTPQEFGPTAYCPPGTLVCGIKTQVEDPSAVSDDAGLCNVDLFCCD